MLCDDKKGRSAAKALNVKIVSAISLLETLYSKKIENVKTNIPENT